MSDQNAPKMMTADQPSHSFSNILAHPGSSWAAAGIILMVIAQAIQAQSLPTTAPGWVVFLASLVTAVFAALGK